MDRMITDAELARLYLSLEGVQLVRDLLTEDDEQIDGYDLDLLASLLSECSPEKCLLILACSAGVMCESLETDPGLKLSLKMLAGDVLDDYAPLYLSAQRARTENVFEGQIIYMQEDLEGFAELFALAGDLSVPDSMLYIVCSILSDQASAQADCLDDKETGINYALDTIQDNINSDPPSLIIFSDNVVPFPGLLRKN
jgi:hypothetical protein